jgi:hypothetical protein
MAWQFLLTLAQKFPAAADVQAARQRTARQSRFSRVSSAQFVPALSPLSNMLLRHEAEAPSQTALIA